MRCHRLVLGVGAWALASSACGDASDPDIARGEIGPEGGLLSSIDSILTLAILPGALDETIELTIERTTDPPRVYGPAFRVQPNLELSIPATVTYRYPLPDDTTEVAVGYVDPQEFGSGVARWRPLPVARLDPAQKLVTATDPHISLFYALLDRGSTPPGTTGDTDTTAGSTTDDSTTTASSTADSETTTGPTSGSITGQSTDDGDTETTGPTGPCDELPMGPFVVEEFLFDGTPLDGNSEDLTFTSLGTIVVRDGAQLVQITPAGAVTPIGTSEALPNTFGLRWTTTNTIVAAALTGELLQIDTSGTVSTLWGGLGIPNGIYPALDGNIFFTDFTGALAAYIDGAGTTLTVLGAGGEDAPQANGIVYDPTRDFVYYVAYGPGLIMRVDVADLANPAAPEIIATIGPEAGGDQVGLDGLAMDACGNLYIVDQNQGAPGSLYRLFLDGAGDPVGAPQLVVAQFPDGVANAVFAQGPGWEAFARSLFVVGLPGRIFMVDVGVVGATTTAGG